MKGVRAKEYGGFGLSPRDCAEQTRLAMAAPGTALGVNMHKCRPWQAHGSFGNKKGEQILRDAAEGRGLLAFGISEPSNDACYSVRPEERRVSFYGKKVFLSMGDIAISCGLFRRDNTGESPISVFAQHRPKTFIVKKTGYNEACSATIKQR